ncbi:flippase-like domain-containing protein [Nocardioides sp. JQ2195]|nr:flippase-like domain-containing protein [Nocardioides sp. JQ2195]
MQLATRVSRHATRFSTQAAARSSSVAATRSAALAATQGPTRAAPEPVTNRRRWWQVAGGVALLALLAVQFGTGPFLDGLLAIRPWALALALVVTAGTTWCCALRWSLVAGWFDERIPVDVAFRAYYRSQLVNATVPGGVVGDVHRGWVFGWRPVLTERVIGQVVQIGLVGALVLPGAWRWAGLAALTPAVVAGGRVALMSVLSTSGHLLLFLVAAATVGVDLPLATLVPVGALVLLGSSIPLNLAGWGPREGIAALAFTTYGASAATGLTVAVTLGVMSTVATLPGLFVLPGGRRGGRQSCRRGGRRGGRRG